ncbi:MAG: enoyl-CoA hydratase/isomerase family protein [Acidimicrobiia bacterium]
MITYNASAGVATIVIDDAERRNPLSNEAMQQLRVTIDRSAADESVHVVVLTGAGDRSFSAGGDLAGGFVDNALPHHAERAALADLFRAMWANPKPIIGRINGVALGGGFGLAVACDITIAVDTAKLGTPEIGLGLWPMMISAVLVRSMPRKALLDMMMTGRVLTATEALDYGLVTRVVAVDTLDAEVADAVAALKERSAAALALGKRSFYSMVDMDIDSALDHLQTGLTATALTEDGVEGVSAFLDKRAPEWKGR